MVAKNFKFLQKHFKDSQKSLAVLLGVTQSMISDYQSGKKQVSVEKLKKISNRYNVSVDDLIYKDLSLEYDFPQTIDLRDFETFCENIFPFYTSSISKNNENFRRAYEIVNVTLNTDNIEEIYGKTVVLEHAITLFKRAWEECSTYVALSNSISIILLIYSMYSNRDMIKVVNEQLSKDCIDLFEIEERLHLETRKEMYESSYIEKKKFIYEKYESFLYNNIKLLKNNPNFSELGDYYLALCYFVGFDDAIEYELSLKIGGCLLYQLCRLGNKYANRLFESIP